METAGIPRPGDQSVLWGGLAILSAFTRIMTISLPFAAKQYRDHERADRSPVKYNKEPLQNPFLPPTTPNAAPPLPNIFLKSPTSTSGTSHAAKCPPFLCSAMKTTFACALTHLHDDQVSSSTKPTHTRLERTHGGSIRYTSLGKIETPFGALGRGRGTPGPALISSALTAS